MTVTIKCPKCDSALPVQAAERDEAIECGACGRQIAVHFSEALRTDRGVDECPVCGGKDFYARKDFNPKTGLAFVVAGGVVSAVFYWFEMDLVAYGILAGAVLVDLVVSRWLGEVTVCYRCHSEFRGRYRVTAPAFDLHLADVFEQEYERRVGRR
jgi:hypothetical protein